MSSIWGQSSIDGNTEQLERRHCRCRRRVRPREETHRGSFFFLLFFLFLLDDEEEAASRSLRSSIILFVCWSERSARGVFDSKRSSCIDCSRNCSFSSSSSLFLSSSSFLRCRRVWRNRSSTGFPWRSGCRAQCAARSAGGGKKRRRQGRTGGSRRGEATQGGALMDDYGDGCEKTQILSHECM